MSLKVKRIVSIMLVAVFAVAMLASCNVVKEDPVVLKVGDKKYTYQDYAEVFNAEIYNYVYNGGEAVQNPEYASMSSTERLKAFQDYAYDKLVEKAVADYLVEKYDLASKLTEDDNNAIDELVKETLKSNASSFESDIEESSVTLDEMKNKGYELTEEEKTKMDETVENEIASAVAAKKAVSSGDESSSDDTDVSDAVASDVVASDEVVADNKGMTDEEAKKAVAEEAGFDTFEEYEKSVRDDAEFDLYFEYYKKDAAMEAYESSFADKDDTFEEEKSNIFEEKKAEYLRDTKLNEYLKGDYKVSDEEAKKYFDDKMAEYKEMAQAEDASNYYTYLNDAMNNEDEEPWYIADGYYYVKHILLKQEESASSDAADSDAAGSDAAGSDVAGSDVAGSDEITVNAEDKAAVETALEEIRTETAEAKKLSDFDKLIEEYGEDPGMEQDPAKTNGYLMGKGNSMVTEFAEASEKLFNDGKGNIGDVTEGVKTEYGIHYIQLVKKLDPKEVTFEDVKDEVVETATEDALENLISEKMAAEKKDIKISRYEDRIRSFGSNYADIYFGQSS